MLDLSTLTADDFRNPVYNASGGIDVEINHPQFGWIPFTAHPDDKVPYGKSVYAFCVDQCPAPYVARPAEIWEIKDEAKRRILQIAPEWKQRNLQMQATMITGKSKLTKQDRADLAEIQKVFDDINCIRARSNELEQMEPRPAEIGLDKHWC